MAGSAERKRDVDRNEIIKCDVRQREVFREFEVTLTELQSHTVTAVHEVQYSEVS